MLALESAPKPLGNIYQNVVELLFVRVLHVEDLDLTSFRESLHEAHRWHIL